MKEVPTVSRPRPRGILADRLSKQSKLLRWIAREQECRVDAAAKRDQESPLLSPSH
jgi:hypothetical protein